MAVCHSTNAKKSCYEVQECHDRHDRYEEAERWLVGSYETFELYEEALRNGDRRSAMVVQRNDDTNGCGPRWNDTKPRSKERAVLPQE
jgi:hypothetical protein